MSGTISLLMKVLNSGRSTLLKTVTTLFRVTPMGVRRRPSKQELQRVGQYLGLHSSVLYSPIKLESLIQTQSAVSRNLDLAAQFREILMCSVKLCASPF